jgi:hypothetical protein
VQVPFNVEVSEELIPHYINFIVIYLFLADCVICVPEPDRNHVFLSHLQEKCILYAILKGVKCLIVGDLNVYLHEELH